MARGFASNAQVKGIEERGIPLRDEVKGKQDQDADERVHQVGHDVHYDVLTHADNQDKATNEQERGRPAVWRGNAELVLQEGVDRVGDGD